MTIRLNRAYTLLALGFIWVLFLGLSNVSWIPHAIFNSVALVALIIVPGTLVLLMLRIKHIDWLTYLLLIIGLGLLFFLVTGLLVNALFPYVGISRPLDQASLFPELSLVIMLLSALTWPMLEPIEIRIPRVITVDVRSLRIALIPILFVCMSIFGSTILNNGGSGWLTLLMLVGALGYGAYVLSALDEIDDTAIAIGIYFLALSFLLMTSLRGSYITGHDIQREYMMFDLTKTNGLWLI